ncbi:MAG: hypothetical protein J1F69_06320 [Clostridiales bacterium]|nr:hypothetical protein [Clostridiales bacterium]
MTDNKKEKFNIIFVCTGNTCRSPMAEFLFKDYLRQKKRSGDFSVQSAGLEAAKGDKITPQAVEALSVMGIKHNPERKAKVFTVQMSLDGDLIVCMTDEHAERVGSDNAISFVDLIGRPISDPYGYSTQAYLMCAAQMQTGFDRILEIADQKLK